MKEFKKLSKIGGVIAIVELYKPIFTDEEQVCKSKQQWQHLAACGNRLWIVNTIIITIILNSTSKCLKIFMEEGIAFLKLEYGVEYY